MIVAADVLYGYSSTRRKIALQMSKLRPDGCQEIGDRHGMLDGAAESHIPLHVYFQMGLVSHRGIFLHE
jgi:hypothetical protein